MKLKLESASPADPVRSDLYLRPCGLLLTTLSFTLGKRTFWTIVSVRGAPQYASSDGEARLVIQRASRSGPLTVPAQEGKGKDLIQFHLCPRGRITWRGHRCSHRPDAGDPGTSPLEVILLSMFTRGVVVEPFRYQLIWPPVQIAGLDVCPFRKQKDILIPRTLAPSPSLETSASPHALGSAGPSSCRRRGRCSGRCDRDCSQMGRDHDQCQHGGMKGIRRGEEGHRGRVLRLLG